jgi:hypothetical protein
VRPLAALAALALGIAAAASPAAPARAMDMEIVGDQIQLSGPVVPGDFDQFQKLIKWRGFRLNVVVLRDSPGGIAGEGFRIAELIRGERMRTAVAGRCFSACALIFLGGTQRGFADDPAPGGNFVAFHGLYLMDGRLARDAEVPTREWIVRFTDRRIDPTLVKIWGRLENMQDAVLFFDPTRFKGRDGASVFICRTADAQRRRPAEQSCDPLADTDGYEQGIFTDRRVVRFIPPRR